MKQRYAWQRFWVPQGGIIDLSDGGFLVDPTDKTAWYSNQKLYTLSELQHYRALALLGEPGIGKSTTLQGTYDSLAQQKHEHAHVFMHDLRAFSSDVFLRSRVFESSEFSAWRNGNSQLTLYLDSLDEALLRVDSVAAFLADELTRHPTTRMSIRIACRTAVWPHEPLETAFRKIWGEDAVGVFELAPLRRKDVAEAAVQHRIDPKRFMQELERANVPFALKPLTLNLLFEIFAKDGHLPGRIIDLYSQGCLRLCEELSSSRRAARRIGRLNGRQRKRLAGRIAAVTMLANRYAVATSPETDPRAEEDVPLSALSTGSEAGEFQPFDVTDDHLHEVLDTGLFSSRGVARMGWAHQSYAEFLAADYLITKQTSSENILKILCHPSGGLIPQLSSVAAWVASRNRAVCSALMAQEPVALLRGDLANWNKDDLAALATALLTAYDEQRAHDFAFGLSNDYRKLAHPGLAGRLRDYIVDSKKHVIARRAAIEIAKACSLYEMQPELLSVALDAADDPSIRASAVSALGRCGDEIAKCQLMPLVRDQLDFDPNQQIKGSALEVLWPSHLTAAEVFALITPPAEGFMGAYVGFLHRLPKSLSDADLLPALQWATEYSRTATRTGDFHRKQLADDIFAKAWEYAENQQVMQAFIGYVKALLKHVHGVFLRAIGHNEEAFRAQLRADTQKRRQFLLAFLRDPEPVKVNEAILLRPLFLQGADLECLLSISPHGTSPIAGVDEQSLCHLIEAICNVNDPAHFEALYDTAANWPPLHQRYEAILDGVPLVSPVADQQREYYRLTQELESTKSRAVDPPPAEHISMGLERFENGEISAWWPLTLNLTLSDGSSYYQELNLRITKTPGWTSADEVTQRRILNAAKRYLEEAAAAVEKWVGKDRYMHSDVAAYRALALLKEIERHIYDDLSVTIWAKWAPVVVAMPRETGTEEGQFYDSIASDAVTNAPDEFARTVQRLIRIERRRSRAQPPQVSGGIPFFILRTLHECWGSVALREVVYAELKNRHNSPAQLEALLECLLKASFEPARNLALRLFSPKRLQTAKGRAYAMAAATQLLVHDSVRSWPKIWKHISTDRTFGSDLFLKVGHDYRHEPPFYLKLSEEELGALYTWLEETFSTETDPDRLGEAFWVGPRESVAHLRRKVLSHLVSLGSEASVLALRRVVAQLPDRKWLAYELLEAERTMRIKTSPADVTRVTQSSSGVLVRSEQDLADLLVSALRKYERELHGEQTPARDLWDRQANGLFRPIDENALSDHVRRFLKRELVDSGIILNREVEIGRVPGAPVGSRTDIKVDALRKSESAGSFATITAVIETKGCWNRELLTAMKTQLVEDYLFRLAAPIGIYMVGWFDKPKWDPNDHRRDSMPGWAVVEAQQRLDETAATLPQAFIVRAAVLDCHCP
jgi:hypothetical protein